MVPSPSGGEPGEWTVTLLRVAVTTEEAVMAPSLLSGMTISPNPRSPLAGGEMRTDSVPSLMVRLPGSAMVMFAVTSHSPAVCLSVRTMNMTLPVRSFSDTAVATWEPPVDPPRVVW